VDLLQLFEVVDVLKTTRGMMEEIQQRIVAVLCKVVAGYTIVLETDVEREALGVRLVLLLAVLGLLLFVVVVVAVVAVVVAVQLVAVVAVAALGVVPVLVVCTLPLFLLWVQKQVSLVKKVGGENCCRFYWFEVVAAGLI